VDGTTSSAETAPRYGPDERLLARGQAMQRMSLTPAQESILSDSLRLGICHPYMVQDLWRVSGHLDVELLLSCLKRIIDRHGALRASFHGRAGEKPYQIIHESAPLLVSSLDLTGYAHEEQEQRLALRLSEESLTPLDPATPPLLRVTLIRVAPDHHWFICHAHPLALDRRSITVILDELVLLYAAAISERQPALAAPVSYSDYVALANSAPTAAAEAYWVRYLAGVTAPSPFPGKFSFQGRCRGGSTARNSVAAYLPTGATRALLELARKEDLTLDVICRAAWALLLSRYSGNREAVFGFASPGLPVSSDGHVSAVGPFINILPMRVTVDEAATVSGWLRDIQCSVAIRPEFELISLPHIEQIARLAGGAQLFCSAVVAQGCGGRAPALHGSGIYVTRVRGFEQIHYPLVFMVGDHEDAQLCTEIWFDPALIAPELAQRISEHLSVILKAFASCPPALVGSVPALGDAERAQLDTWSGASCRAPIEDCVLTTFERVVRRTAGKGAETDSSMTAAAVEESGEKVTYSDIAIAARAAAIGLRARGAQPGDIIGIHLPRSTAAIIAILGILYADCAYLGLDPELPRQRISAMIELSRPRLVVTDSGANHDFNGLAVTLPDLQAGGWSSDRAESAKPGNSLAYVVFTSGSTGVPKGVLIEHRALANYTARTVERYNLNPGDRVLIGASLSVDWFASEIFPTLASGATAVLRTEQAYKDVRCLLEFCRQQRISVLLPPTALWHQIVRELADGESLPRCIRLIDIGGERAIPSLVHTWRRVVAGRVVLLNGYGPTEATISATSFALAGPAAQQVEGWTEVPIGRPLPNVLCYVLDREGRRVPIGAVGQLHIGGAGVARGYLGDPALTTARFVPNPFAPPSLMYRTGDLVRWLSDGNLEYLGRSDRQIKVHGHRVELTEVEATLLQHPEVREVYLMPSADSDGELMGITAYLVPSGPRADMATLRAFLAERLPAAFIPTSWVQVASLPRTTAGKLDVSALPKPIRAHVTSGVAPPGQSALAARIHEACAEILGADVDMDASFLDAGGNSLLAMRLLLQLRHDLSVELSLRSLFSFGSLSEIAISLAGQQAGP
jgi:amino acid adenylation domain-containing protein